MLNKLYSIIFLLVIPTIGFSQVEEINPPDFIKTITFRSNTTEGQLPILKLGETLNLEFDALTGDEEDFYYKIEHFNFDWTPSNLMKSEYLSGIDGQRIRDYTNSLNTFQIYSHYDLTIPNQQTRRLLKSGNYLITIYDSYDEIMFSRKFMIFEDLLGVGVQVKRTRNLNNIQEKQIVNLKINSNNLNLVNPKQTVKTLIIQNNNLNATISNLKPQFTIGNELIYRYDDEASFWGGNEYLYFETKEIRGANIAVQYVDLRDLYHSYLFNQINRSKRPYTYFPDINGNFVITALNVDDVDSRADYSIVHFSLNNELLLDKKIYVYGNYNNYALEPANEMIYNSEKQVYECVFPLKQGFYNYKYVAVDANGNLDEGAISGNFWQTENNYKVLVYYRDLGARFDRLIGFGETNSEIITN
ncbi:type IX secretion system plug protein [Winogradskyella immobilis]|uniref:DUF5103 domain-containing protein n=1 Tax=Winogradskyella immobilis TaxID=2816852 RepID=A0ABS8EJ65_9FLAO|nr:DUF5103 domain-containing protein [Winogradskyella immobilis]MCC1483239.1 DUF5103 domain-containing protein [Winogradskyella immobilis]MCG0015333.1 DUF5103 domain-containing protein [Winogradskyella immobilis]